MQIFSAQDYKRMPWKNGGGETAEIAVSPHNAGIDSFDWRISMATVATDGPFSSFPGIDRTLTVLRGNGIELAVDGRHSVSLTRASSPFSFSADTATQAKLKRGKITDLNVMTRRGRFSHLVQFLSLPAQLDASDTLRFVFCVEPDVKLNAHCEVADLAALDCVSLEAGESVGVSGEGIALLISLQQH